MKLIFLDTETTTHLKDIAEIWQFSSIKVDTDLKTKKTLNKIICPRNDISIDALVKCNPPLNEINKAKLFREVANEIKDFLEFDNPNVVYIAHNAKFDRTVLIKEFEHVDIDCSNFDIKEKWMDTLKLAKDRYQDLVYSDINGDHQPVKLNLPFLYYWAGIELDNENFHSADFDVQVLIELYKKLSTFYTSIKEMIDISNKPVLLNRFKFGKHAGKLIKEVVHSDFNYIKWLVQNLESLNPESNEFDEDLYFTIQENIKDL